MSSTMKAAVMEGIGKISIRNIPVPEPKAHEVLVRVKHCGICGSDLHYFTDGRIGDFIVEAPIVLGHEAGGVVEKVGADVKHLKAGDVVSMEPGIACGKCESCKTGNYNLCPDVQFFATPPVGGTFQEYVAHDASLCFKVPDNMDTVEAALVEPLAVGFHSAARADAHVGQTAVVLGAGCIGLCCVMALRARGVSTVYISDIVDKRLAKAREIGAAETINAKNEDIEEVINKLTDGRGADVVIETAGTEATYQQAIKIAKPNAAVVYVGYTASGYANIPMSTALNKELDIRPVFRYRHMYPAIIEAIASGSIDAKKIVSHYYELDELQKAMEYSSENKEEVIKAVIKL